MVHVVLSDFQNICIDGYYVYNHILQFLSSSFRTPIILEHITILNLTISISLSIYIYIPVAKSFKYLFK